MNILKNLRRAQFRVPVSDLFTYYFVMLSLSTIGRFKLNPMVCLSDQ